MTTTPTHLPSTHPSRSGFTLFEVAISLVIVTVGVLSVMMLMPAGLKAQQMARFQILASAKAIEIMSVNANQWKKWDEQRMEGQSLGLCSINQAAQTPIIEQKMTNWRHGSLPVPLDIARRLDSDNDEIQTILAQGGYLFYSSPRPIASDNEEALGLEDDFVEGRTNVRPPTLEDREISNESQRLVYAFVGPAQQPALASHPCKAWPYYDWYPTPPRARTPMDASSPNSRHEDSWRLNDWPERDAFLKVVTAWKTAIAKDPPLKADMITYRDRANELASLLGISMTAGVPENPPGDPFTKVDAWKVLAVGYIAQANVWLTRGSLSPAATAIDYKLARDTHEVAMKWLYRHVTTDPYDWGIDRSLNFQTGWDIPLLQYQLFYDTDATALAPFVTLPFSGDRSWYVLSGQRVTNAGTSSSYGVTSVKSGEIKPGVPARPYGNRNEIASSWGNQTATNTFNLTNPFQPMDRCRQLVFWAVDWKSYADAETAPSAPQDASRLPYDSDGKHAYNAGAHKFHNPERFFTFKDAKRDEFLDTISNKNVYLGMFGADRNGNRRLDIGPVPTSVRMRAIKIARFNVYNPRVWTGLRN